MKNKIITLNSDNGQDEIITYFKKYISETEKVFTEKQIGELVEQSEQQKIEISIDVLISGIYCGINCFLVKKGDLYCVKTNNSLFSEKESSSKNISVALKEFQELAEKEFNHKSYSNVVLLDNDCYVGLCFLSEDGEKIKNTWIEFYSKEDAERFCEIKGLIIV